ncbi:putative DNA-binding domain-containing protein [Piscinibacter sp. XHJ-5]|uniref:HvfC/BufC family peptide modification chaperone n=1 Tax=Piscinibacter sp. XHJ-5 TaxID=3037797 RepID=UPI0024529CBC|nr:putative DNA-binding domain-containing protein [Piscinibacter sp. XHJ-5]
MSLEADRQRRLVASLLVDVAGPGSLAVRGPEARALRGLQAYRANADASAARALASAFPTVELLIGHEDFALLARRFWRERPPQRGDLGEWGDLFADWLAAEERLADWPYVGDCARLDWALHVCERAADAELDPATIERLGDTDPSRLVAVLAPGLALIDSRWPIARIHAAHRDPHDRGFAAVREAIAREEGECVLVAREGWKAIATALAPAHAPWMRSLIAGCDLGRALEQAPQGFDFGAWLATALQSGWVKGLRVLPD